MIAPSLSPSVLRPVFASPVDTIRIRIPLPAPENSNTYIKWTFSSKEHNENIKWTWFAAMIYWLVNTQIIVPSISSTSRIGLFRRTIKQLESTNYLLCFSWLPMTSHDIPYYPMKWHNCHITGACEFPVNFRAGLRDRLGGDGPGPSHPSHSHERSRA